MELPTPVIRETHGVGVFDIRWWPAVRTTASVSEAQVLVPRHERLREPR